MAITLQKWHARLPSNSLAEENAYQMGIKIVTTITRTDQEAAYSALRQGIMDYDLRHGYRGPENFVDLPDATAGNG